MKNTIYLVDDEESIRQGVGYGLKSDYAITTFPTAEDALTAIKRQRPDLVLLDIRLPGIDGVEALKQIKAIDPHILVIMVTGLEDIKIVVSVMKLGAYDYVIKPIQMDILKVAIKKALETVRLQKELQSLQEKQIKENMPCIIGESNAIQDVMQFVNKAAVSPDTPILITGESGTGKELIAQAIHQKSPNSSGRFITINCAAIPRELVESELFGYEKGAFTGADPAGKKGLIEEAANSTLFLDEIGDLNLDVQAKLLRFLDHGYYYKVGGTRELQANVRLVTATNKNLEEMIEEKQFRLDLFYRIGVIRVQIPSLNERREDILPIATHFLANFSQKFNKPFTKISSKAETLLKNHRWLGNIRELKNLIERAVIIGNYPEIKSEDLGLNYLSPANANNSTNISDQTGFTLLPEEGLDLEAMETHFIEEAIKKANGNDAKAAQLLKMSYYAFRYRKKKISVHNK